VAVARQGGLSRPLSLADGPFLAGAPTARVNRANVNYGIPYRHESASPLQPYALRARAFKPRISDYGQVSAARADEPVPVVVGAHRLEFATFDTVRTSPDFRAALLRWSKIQIRHGKMPPPEMPNLPAHIAGNLYAADLGSVLM
jgi:hypothetical protein